MRVETIWPLQTDVSHSCVLLSFPPYFQHYLRLDEVELIRDNQLPIRINYTRILTTEVLVHDFWDGNRHFDNECVKVRNHLDIDRQTVRQIDRQTYM